MSACWLNEDCIADYHQDGECQFPSWPPEAIEATPERAAEIAGAYLKEALRYLEDGDSEHAAVWIDSALIWMGQR